MKLRIYLRVAYLYRINNSKIFIRVELGYTTKIKYPSSWNLVINDDPRM